VAAIGPLPPAPCGSPMAGRRSAGLLVVN